MCFTSLPSPHLHCSLVSEIGNPGISFWAPSLYSLPTPNSGALTKISSCDRLYFFFCIFFPSVTNSFLCSWSSSLLLSLFSTQGRGITYIILDFDIMEVMIDTHLFMVKFFLCEFKWRPCEVKWSLLVLITSMHVTEGFHHLLWFPVKWLHFFINAWWRLQIEMMNTHYNHICV